VPARSESVAAHTAATFACNTSGYIAAILTGIVVARAVGPAGKGAISYAALVMALFTTFGNGIASAVLQRYRSDEPLRLVYGSAVRLIGMTMVPAALLLAGFAVMVPNYAVLAFAACAIPFAVYGQVANSVFLLHDDVRSTLVQSGFTTFGLALATIPAVTILHAGVTAILAIWAGTFVAAGIFATIRIGTYVPALSLPATWDSLRAHGLFALKAGTGGLAAFLNLRIDVFIVGALLDARLLGVYSLGVATGELMWQVSRPLVWSTMGRIAAAPPARAIALTLAVTRTLLIAECALGAALFAFAPAAVRFVYGDAYAASGTIVRWLLPGLIAFAAQDALAYFVTVYAARPLVALAVQSASLALCSALSFVLVPHIGITGAALATSATYVCAAVANATLFLRSTGTPPARLFGLRAALA